MERGRTRPPAPGARRVSTLREIFVDDIADEIRDVRRSGFIIALRHNASKNVENSILIDTLFAKDSLKR
jgi:hypothetical protein